MASRRIRIDIEAHDDFSRVLGNLKSGLSGIGTGLAVGVGSSISTAIINGVSASVGKVGQLFTKALDFESLSITGGNLLQFNQVFGKDLDKNIDGFQSIYADLEKVAAKLPGATEDYGDVLIQMMGSISKAGSGMKALDFKNFSVEMVRDFGLLQQAGKAQGLLPKDVGRAVNAFANGDSLKNLAGTELFTKGGNFAQALNQIVEIEGIGATYSDRLKQAAKAARNSISGDALDAYASTLSSQFEGLKTDLFGMEGLFSFSKDIYKQTSKVESVFSAIKELVSNLIGDNGLFTNIGKIGDNLGLTFNPMKSLYLGIVKINNFIRLLNKTFSSVADDNLTNFGDVFKSISQTINNFVNSSKIIDSLFPAITKSVQFLVNNLIIKPLNFIANNPIAVAGIIARINVFSLKIIGSILKGILGAFLEIDWKILIVAGLVTAFAAIFPGVITSIFVVIGGFILGSIGLLTAPITLGIVAIGLIITGLFLLIKNNFSEITLYLSVIWTQVKLSWQLFTISISNFFTWLSSIWTGTIALVTGLWNLVKTAIATFFTWNASIWSGIIAVCRSYWSSASANCRGFFSWLVNIWNELKSFAVGKFSQISGAISGMVNGIIASIRNAVANVIPGNIGSIPSGNATSAKSLPRASAKAISSTGNRSYQANNVINVNGSGHSVNKIASLVVDKLDSQYQQYRYSQA